MTVSLKHKFTSAVADGGDTNLVQPSNWNDEHDLVMATDRLLGRTTAGTGAAEEISAGTGLTLASGTLTFSGTLDDVTTNGATTTNAVTFGGVTVSDPDPSIYITDTTTGADVRIYSNDEGDLVLSADNSAEAANSNIQFVVDGFGRGTINVNAAYWYIITNFTNGVKVDTIDEYTADSGVTIDGVLLKDGAVDGVTIDPTGITDGYVLTADGANGAAWEAPAAGGGATGGGSDQIFWNNGVTVTTDYTIPSSTNAGTFGPVTVDSGVTVTVPSGSTWTIV
jgi:hypothetical protein